MAVNLTGTAFVEEVTYSTFGCKVFGATPGTPDKLTPNVVHKRHGVVGGTLLAPDGKELKYWSFVDSSLPVAQQVAAYPSPTIRVKQGQIVHTTLTTAKGPHTIHHHGIEPSTANDGVGHVSFEVKDSYTYQWQPQHAGTFFYHCHRNTVFHFEMGLLGLLIVDPPQGPGRVFENGPAYDVEKCWVLDDMDPRWHLIDEHDAGLCGMDVGFNRFEPKYFLLSGVFNNRTTIDSRAVVTAPLGKRILIRLLNASYSEIRMTLACDATLVSRDGHGLGRNAWNSTKLIPAGTPFDVCTAQRYDLILYPMARGSYTAKFEFRHWITGQIQNNGAGVLQTKVVVT